MWGVAPSCMNHCLPTGILISPTQEETADLPVYGKFHLSLIRRRSMKNGPIRPCDEMAHQTVTRWGWSGDSWIMRGFCFAQKRMFCLLTYPVGSTWASSVNHRRLSTKGCSSHSPEWSGHQCVEKGCAKLQASSSKRYTVEGRRHGTYCQHVKKL